MQRKMAPPKPSCPQLTIAFNKCIPSGGRRNYALTSTDFHLSWLEYIKKHDPVLFRDVLAKKDHVTIMDKRTSQVRKVWKLSSTVKEFLDSFGRILQTYKATIGTQVSNTDNNATALSAGVQTTSTSLPGGSNSNKSPMNRNGRVSSSNTPPMRNARIPPSQGNSQASTRTSSRNKPVHGDLAKAGPAPSSSLKRKINGVAPSESQKRSRNGCLEEVAIHVGGSTTNGNQMREKNANGPVKLSLHPVLDVDDSASMAPTVDSQDSQDDLREAGVKIEEIKSDVINRMVGQCDNNTMLRMKLELQNLIKNQKFFSITRKLPVTAGVLQYIFQLNSQ